MRVQFRTLVAVMFALIVTCAGSLVAISLPSPETGHALSRHPITSGAWNDMEPSYSPDGRRIAFSSDRDGSYDIWVMDSDGGRAMQLTSLNGDERFPKWSHDGRMIAFLFFSRGMTDIWTIKIDGTGISNLTKDDASEKNFEWSPTQDMLVFDSDRSGRLGIWLTHLPEGHLSGVSAGFYPSWTPDGAEILYSAIGHGDFLKIFSRHLRSGFVSQLTSGSGNDIKPRMSPDGQYVAFVSDRGGRETLWIMNADGTNMHEARSDPPMQQPGLSWQPEVASNSYPLWNPKNPEVIYSGKEALSFFRYLGKDPMSFVREGIDIVPVSGPSSDVIVFYQGIPVVAYYYWEALNLREDPALYDHWTQQGDSIIQMAASSADEVSPSWRPDGGGIIYASNEDGTFHIWSRTLEEGAPSPYG